MLIGFDIFYRCRPIPLRAKPAECTEQQSQGDAVQYRGQPTDRIAVQPPAHVASAN
jgi:hypothetical protein